ncbi:MAG: four helix bundle protein [Phycisphaeraceae bacterium]|nr:four helix bundle protein [Phycisphaeraceae bacterium]
MGDTREYRELEMCTLSIDLTVARAHLTWGSPKEASFTRTLQVGRAAGSIPAVMAEGHGPQTTCDPVLVLRSAQDRLNVFATPITTSDLVALVHAGAIEIVTALTERLGRLLQKIIRAFQERRG